MQLEEATYKVFLDDLRVPLDIYPKTENEQWVIVRNLKEFKEVVESKGVPDYISFDNDLGASLEEGKDAVKWMVYEKELDVSNMDFIVHSANVSGVREYIEALLKNWKKELKRRNEQQ
ncbi:MAG: cyclic-phosphate processing receiver domain-containing protein [Nanoarchaeota archaeon]